MVLRKTNPMKKLFLLLSLFLSFALYGQMMNNNSLIASKLSEPIAPPSLGTTTFPVGGTGYAYINSRQTALEPSTSGVDHAMTWSFWVRVSNVGVDAQRIFGNAFNSDGTQQYGLFLQSQTVNSANNQKIQFSLFTNSTNFLTIRSTNRFLKNRWTHVVVTYDGSETGTGLEFYFNGELDATADHNAGQGTYTGALNSANLRFQLSSFFASANRFRGNMRNFGIWNRVLTQSEINFLYNNGTPVNNATAPFYADIIADWPLFSNVNCANNATYNFTNDTVGFNTVPISASAQSMSFQNALIGNTRYLAFGTAIGENFWIRSGDNHLDNGYIVKGNFNHSNLYASNPVTWTGNILDDLPNDLRGLYCQQINDKIFGFTSQYNDATTSFIATGRYESTDGLVGESFGSFINMQSALPGESLNFYGNPIKGDAVGQYFAAMHEYTASAQNIYIFETVDNGATWNKLPLAFSGGVSEGYNEPCILRVGENTYVMLVRAVNGLHCSVSLDGCQTWSVPVNSGLAAGPSMAAMCLNPNRQIVVVYADRSDGFLKVSNKNNVADILANRTNWNAGSGIWKTIDDGNNILGYPTIVPFGWYYAVTVSSEFSSTRADLFVGYGLFGF